MAAVEPTEFQAVIMAAGKGSRMTDLTAARPKCLLPIGCKPMLWYPLQLLERNGFQEVILIVQEAAKAEIQLALEKQGLKIHIDIVGIPATEDWGTADSLRHVGKKITTDCVVLSCDTLTDFRLRDILDVFRVRQASLAAVFFRPDEVAATGTVPGPKTRSKPERDVTGLESGSDRLVYCRSASDLQDTLPIRKRLLRKHLRVAFYTSLVDSHIYVLKHWVLDLLANDSSLSTLKGELVPYVVKHQLGRPSKRAKEGPDTRAEPSTGDKEIQAAASGSPTDLMELARESALTLKTRHLSLHTDNPRDLREPFLGDAYRCHALVAAKGTVGVRVNTLAALCHANQQVYDWWPGLTGDLPPPAAQHADSHVLSTQVCARSFVHEHTTVAARTSVARSLVGPRSDVRDKARLQRCVLLGGNTVHEGAVLTNCLLCDGAVVEANARLTDCVVGAGFTVSGGATHTNETLTELEDLMEI